MNVTKAAPEPGGKPVVLVFCRPYLVADFRNMMKPLQDRFDFSFLTDAKKTEVETLGPNFYKHLSSGICFEGIDEKLEAEIIARCRMLRNLAPKEARALIHAMANSVSEAIDRIRPATVFSQVTDEYVTHLVAIVSTMRGLSVTQYCHSYFKDRMYISEHSYGVGKYAAETSPEDVEDSLERISRIEYRQDYNNLPRYTFLTHLKRFFRYQLKRALFLIKGIAEHDRLYVHYAITPYLAERKHLRDYPRPSFFDPDWASKISTHKAANPDNLAIYLPLAYWPESTIDYWIADLRLADYEKSTVEMIRALRADKGLKVFVKEHFHMLGMRRPEFYKELSALGNVVLVPPAIYSNSVLTQCDAVLLGAGSSGVEAIMHERPILTYCDTSYWYTPSGATYLDYDKLALWPNEIRNAIAGYEPHSSEDKRSALKTMMDCTLPIREAGKVWPIADAEAVGRVIDHALETPPSPELGHVSLRARVNHGPKHLHRKHVQS